MKITFVLHQFLPDYFTGTEQYAYAMGQELLKRGHEIEIFTLDPNFDDDTQPYAEDRFMLEGLPVTRTRYWWGLHRDFDMLEYRNPYAGVRFGKYLEHSKPDLVHVFHLRYFGADILDETRRREIPTVVNLMDFWYLCQQIILVKANGELCDGPGDATDCLSCVNAKLANELKALQIEDAIAQRNTSLSRYDSPGWTPTERATSILQRPRYLREKLLGADSIIAPSHALKEIYMNNGIGEDRITVIPYGLGEDRLAQLDTVRAEHSTADTLTIGFMGSIAPHKGVHLLLDAFEKIKGKVRLLIHGRETDFPEYSAEIAARAAKDPRIELRGPFGLKDLGHVLGEIDLLAAPSMWYENTPFVILEALAARVPVFATDLGGLAEILSDEKTGELFARGDADDLAFRIRRIMAEPERLDRYRAAISPVRGLESNALDFEDLYVTLA